ncbi:class A beta-lactamase-related serine hydrolase [Kitasatospora sp. GAS204B]|uniref:class A beta-lactamase-related serine hydrolase n=1 Tax=unclassified Kitasatospora TaxID=2633591 RepID=UPI002473705E|nr:class A beta-lactamase-related serine hydrolase [Kitasatospora sp. GAS204B]MDH6121777.1 beta-lactamase class A [Kitasatospora sp. GAS204B]
MNSQRAIRALRAVLADGGLSGSFLVRDLATGEEVGIDPDVELPLASLVKIPLAAAVLERIQDGRIDAATMIDVLPERSTAAGPVGLSRFRHPARIAVEDLLYLSTAFSDNAAADALFHLVPPAEVNDALANAGLTGITVRHPMRELTRTPAERFEPREVHLAQSLAIGSRTAGHGHPIPQLDVSQANSGTARACVDLLQALWLPTRIPPAVAEQVRALMGQNVIRHRLAPDFSSDASRWSSKTGTLLNLRHEIGVVEHEDGSRYAIAALTESSVPAAAQPMAEAVMARVARALHDLLRAR